MSPEATGQQRRSRRRNCFNVFNRIALPEHTEKQHSGRRRRPMLTSRPNLTGLPGHGDERSASHAPNRFLAALLTAAA